MASKKPAPKKPAPKAQEPPAGNLDTEKRNPLEDLGQVKADAEERAAKPAPKKPAAKKRGPGRPPKQPEPEPVDLDFDVQDLTIALDLTFKMIASRRGAHWLLQPEELERLAVCYDRLLQKYLPSFEAWAPEINATIATCSIFIPRGIYEYQLIKQRKAQEQQGEKPTNDSPAK